MTLCLRSTRVILGDHIAKLVDWTSVRLEFSELSIK